MSRQPEPRLALIAWAINRDDTLHPAGHRPITTTIAGCRWCSLPTLASTVEAIHPEELYDTTRDSRLIDGPPLVDARHRHATLLSAPQPAVQPEGP